MKKKINNLIQNSYIFKENLDKKIKQARQAMNDVFANMSTLGTGADVVNSFTKKYCPIRSGYSFTQSPRQLEFIFLNDSIINRCMEMPIFDAYSSMPKITITDIQGREVLNSQQQSQLNVLLYSSFYENNSVYEEFKIACVNIRKYGAGGVFYSIHEDISGLEIKDIANSGINFPNIKAFQIWQLTKSTGDSYYDFEIAGKRFYNIKKNNVITISNRNDIAKSFQFNRIFINNFPAISELDFIHKPYFDYVYFTHLRTEALDEYKRTFIELDANEIKESGSDYEAVYARVSKSLGELKNQNSKHLTLFPAGVKMNYKQFNSDMIRDLYPQIKENLCTACNTTQRRIFMTDEPGGNATITQDAGMEDQNHKMIRNQFNQFLEKIIKKFILPHILKEEDINFDEFFVKIFFDEAKTRTPEQEQASITNKFNILQYLHSKNTISDEELNKQINEMNIFPLKLKEFIQPKPIEEISDEELNRQINEEDDYESYARQGS